MAGWNLRRRSLGVVFAVCYLSASAAFLALHACGLSPAGALAYGFSWDMFPGFQAQSARRVAIGQTRSGRYWLLHPSSEQQYRQGVADDDEAFDPGTLSLLWT